MFRTASLALAVFLLPWMLTALPAQANDSSGFQGTSGIALSQNSDVRMVSEDLYISPGEIRVEYVFRNITDHPVETLVAFPLPDLDLSAGISAPNWIFPAQGPNFLDFKLWVDGRPVAPALERRAIFHGKDVTEILARAGALDLAPWLPGAYEKQTKAMPRQVLDRLHREGLLAEDEDPDMPQWILRAKYFWTQQFPAGADVRIRHTYKPFAGHALVENADGIDGRKTVGRLLGDRPADDDRYCLDTGTRKALKMASHGSKRLLDAVEIEYILTTARNWLGPIGRFHLTIDKAAAGDVASLCWPGLRKTGPTTFEATSDNFTPDRDIKLLLFHVVPLENQ